MAHADGQLVGRWNAGTDPYIKSYAEADKIMYGDGMFHDIYSRCRSVIASNIYRCDSVDCACPCHVLLFPKGLI